MICPQRSGFVPKYGQKLSTWAASDNSGVTCSSHQDRGTGLFWHLSFVWRLNRQGLEREKERNGAFWTVQGEPEALTKQSNRAEVKDQQQNSKLFICTLFISLWRSKFTSGIILTLGKLKHSLSISLSPPPPPAVCVDRGVCVHELHMHTADKLVLDLFLNRSLPYFLRQGLSLNLGFTYLESLAGQQAPGSSWLPVPSLWDHRHTAVPSIFI